jgi:RTX calcium-binding nonapeptide repeat (4 copies)
MAKQAGSKLKNGRPIASVTASTVNEISLLERVSLLASILLSLKASTTEAAAAEGFAAETLAGEATTDSGAASEGIGKPFQPLEIARLPETTAEDQLESRAGGAGTGEHRLAAESNADPLQPIAPAQADAALKAIARGSSTSPALLKIEVVAEETGSAPLSLEKLVPATPVSDIIIRPIPATTFLFTGPAGPNNFDIFIGTGRGPNTVDFSGLEGLLAAVNPIRGEGGIVIRQDASAPNGVFVDLSANAATAETAVGPVTVQAWQLDAHGKAAMPLAHLENIANVTGTIGNDVVIGNANANTFTYTAADGTHEGQSASYGFDVYYGGPSGTPNDAGDTVDFSRLGTQESVAAAPASTQTLLPHDAKGITLDLARAVRIAMVDPVTGETSSVTGSLVATVGGAEQTDLALLAWSAPAEGGEGAQATIERIVGTVGADVVFGAAAGSEAHSSIENIITSGGCDAIWGDSADNTVSVSGNGENGPIYFDGRGSSDTVDLSQLKLTGTSTGIEVHLNQTNNGATDPTGAQQSGVAQISLLGAQGSSSEDAVVAQVKDVENVVGSCGDDVIEGDRNDNVLSGGGGSDSFVFADLAVVDGRGITNIGHDIIRDFRTGDIDDDDYLVFDSQIFNFHDGSSLDWLQQLLNNNQIRDEDEGMIIWIDENNSITLQNYELDDYSGHGLGLAAYSSWIVFV